MCIMYGNKITQLRKAANMTQGQLGELLNVSPQAISKWEHNLSEPDLTTMKKIWQALPFVISSPSVFHGCPAIEFLVGILS